jgi:hypothetical protein
MRRYGVNRKDDEFSAKRVQVWISSILGISARRRFFFELSCNFCSGSISNRAPCNGKDDHLFCLPFFVSFEIKIGYHMLNAASLLSLNKINDEHDQP